MGLLIASILALGFVANVAIGSVSGDAPLGNVAEMVLLFFASIAFVAEILRREARAQHRDPDD